MSSLGAHSFCWFCHVAAHLSDSCCWATSYGACEKTQTVDLGFEGLDGALMDEVQPEIKVAEW